MPVELLTYAALATRLDMSREGARSLAKRMRLPRALSNDGKALVSVDVDAIQQARRSPRPNKSNIATLQTEIARLEQLAATHQTDCEHERDRANRLMADLLNATAETMAAQETAARLRGELAVLRAAGPRRVPGRLRRLAGSVVEADRKASASGDDDII